MILMALAVTAADLYNAVDCRRARLRISADTCIFCASLQVCRNPVRGGRSCSHGIRHIPCSCLMRGGWGLDTSILQALGYRGAVLYQYCGSGQLSYLCAWLSYCRTHYIVTLGSTLDADSSQTSQPLEKACRRHRHSICL